MSTRQVRTQAELAKALADGVDWIDLVGNGEFTVTAYGSATVTAYDSATVRASDSATVRAYGSATVRAYGSATVTASDLATVTASDSATVRAYGSATVTAYDSATVRAYGSATVTAYGSATVTAYGSATVTAYGSATVRAYDSATVRAYDLVPVHDYGPRTTVEAALHIPVKVPETMQEWTDYYGSPVSRGWATVYKAVDADLKSGYGFSYPVGDEVKAPDWSDVASCGQGLHFSPRAFMALSYAPNASRFLACKVKVSECVVLGDKIKAPRCKVLAEVNEDGDEVSA